MDTKAKKKLTGRPKKGNPLPGNARVRNFRTRQGFQGKKRIDFYIMADSKRKLDYLAQKIDTSRHIIIENLIREAYKRYR